MPQPIEARTESSSRLNSIQRSLFENEVIEQLKTVYDPELPVNIYDLGLIYDIQVSDNRDTHIVMTLTTPACPVAGSLPGEVESAARAVEGIGEVSVELTWDPPFTIDMIAPEVRLMLGLD